MPRITLVLGVRITRTINLRGPVVSGRETIYLNAIPMYQTHSSRAMILTRNRREHRDNALAGYAELTIIIDERERYIVTHAYHIYVCECAYICIHIIVFE